MEQEFTCQVVAIPYPGRGHINPMMNLCKLIAIRRPDILITFIVTEEWHGFLSSESKPANIRFGKIPNVIPSEIGRGKNFAGFVDEVLSKMKGPVECLIDQLEPPTLSVIVYDTYLLWVVGLANRKSIPAASFWTMSATVFSILRHCEVLLQNDHYPLNPLDTEKGERLVDYLPGVPPMRVADLPRDTVGGVKGRELLKRATDAVSLVAKTQYVLFSSVYEVESQVIDSLKSEYPIPVYAIGPAVPYFNIKGPGSQSTSQHIEWLDAQPKDSVLYISQGSYLSASSEQLDEVIAGVHDSGIKFFWVVREDISRYQGAGVIDKGLVVPWCDQLKVLCHPSIGGFWTHCGWNSAKEGAYAGIPMLIFPIMWDQFTNCKQTVDDWKIGWRLKKDDQILIRREEISRILKRFMDLDSDEGKAMRRRAQELREISQRATAEGGSSELQIEAFIDSISQ